MTHACGHDHSGEDGLSGQRLASQLSQTEVRLGQSGERLTTSRKRVLELLLESGQPIKAYDLMAAFQPGAAPAKPPTVYRALEFLEKQGLVHRIQSLNAYVACRREEGHAAAFLICDCCGATDEIDPPVGGMLNEVAGAKGFTVQAVTVEAHGLCADCRHGQAA